ncbi:MAG: ferritin family protein [Bacillota bacterium]|nr:ferritin family protein [Bacillota bacterium]
MSELINEDRLGATQKTQVEEAVEANFRGETSEVGLYLAMARQAQREGYPEVAQALKEIAWDEAEHAAYFAELNGKISSSVEENLKKMLAGERAANRHKREAAVASRDCGVDHAHDIFDLSSRDEARHARILEGLLKRYFGCEQP